MIGILMISISMIGITMIFIGCIGPFWDWSLLAWSLLGWSLLAWSLLGWSLLVKFLVPFGLVPYGRSLLASPFWFGPFRPPVVYYSIEIMNLIVSSHKLQLDLEEVMVLQWDFLLSCNRNSILASHKTIWFTTGESYVLLFKTSLSITY